MTPQEYIKKVLRTEPDKYLFKGTNGVSERVEHGVMGVVTEAGELMDAVKKSKIYGKPLDAVNLQEEVGDVMWYLAVLCDALGVSFEKIWDMNIDKLSQRFPEKLTPEQALDRDLDSERKVLES